MQNKLLTLTRNKLAHIDAIRIEYELYDREIKRKWLSVKRKGPGSMLQIHEDLTSKPSLCINIGEKLAVKLVRSWGIREDSE